MDQEEFERLKQAEKEHLKAVRNLKQKLRRAEQLGRINKALREMNPDALLEQHDASLDAVLRETLEAEARLSVAMEQANLTPPEEIIGPDELDEEELRKARAAELVRQLKAEDERTSSAQTSAEEHSEAPSATDPDDELPEKTIGRRHPARRNQSDGNTSDRA